MNELDAEMDRIYKNPKMPFTPPTQNTSNMSSTNSSVFGKSSTTAFGQTSTPSNAFPQSNFGSLTTFGSNSSPFAQAQTSTPTFGQVSTPTFGQNATVFGQSSLLNQTQSTFGQSFGQNPSQTPSFGQSSSLFSNQLPLNPSSFSTFGQSNVSSTPMFQQQPVEQSMEQPMEQSTTSLSKGSMDSITNVESVSQLQNPFQESSDPFLAVKFILGAIPEFPPPESQC